METNANTTIGRPNILTSTRRKQKDASPRQVPKVNAIEVICEKSIEREVKEEPDAGDDNATVPHLNTDTSSNHRCTKCCYCSDHLPKSKKLKKFPCLDCKEKGESRIFSTKIRLDLHKNTDHVPESSSYVCKQCDGSVVFSSKTKYKYHLNAKHPNGAKFFCDYCFLEFKLKANYKSHLATHNVPPDKKFSCTVCGGSFVTHSVYVSHMRRFPGPHSKHECNICGITFSHEKRLKNHRCKKLLLEEAEARLAEENEAAAQAGAADASDSAQMYRIPDQVMVSDVIDNSVSEQLIIKDVTGQIIPANHVLRFDIQEDGQTGEPFYQVNVADWNMVAPFVIRGGTCQQEPSATE